MQIYSFSPFGYEGSLVTIEVDLRRGIPAVDIVGLADGAVKESRERMQAAIRNSQFDFPPERVLISLSPADLKKEGAGFDLPIALAVLFRMNCENSSQNFINVPVLVMGELELSGKIRSVKGIRAAVSTAMSYGINHFIIPSMNAVEAKEVSGAKVFGAESLIDAYKALNDISLFKMKEDSIQKEDNILFPPLDSSYSFDEIKGQYKLIRALQIAAAGGHNLIAMGAPGCGKTMSIQRFPGINPLLSLEEAQSVTRIWSLAGLIKPNEGLIRTPPFRMPHQTASLEGICGGGCDVRPGEISLAHNGVLFLDEAAEFKNSVLQTLRVPLESGSITISRAGRTTVYPARFQLLMAVNPCPCGNFGSKTKLCLCSARSIEQYWRKFSAPLLDRIDLRVFVENHSDSPEEQQPRKQLTTTEEIRSGIEKALIIQRNRQQKRNAHLEPGEIEKICHLGRDENCMLELSTSRYGFSPRAIASILKVARTIADIDGEQNILGKHLSEAIDYRRLCSNGIPETI